MLFMGERRVREDRADLREGRKEQLAMDDGGVDSREYRARLQSERIWEEHFWWLATEMMEKLLGDADSRRACAGDGFERVESNDWRGKIMWIQENTTVRENIGKTLLWLATEMMEKLLGDADSRLKKLRIAREVQLRFQQI